MYAIILIILTFLILGIGYYFYQNKVESQYISSANFLAAEEVEKVEDESVDICVDIKGKVNNPGVYCFNEETIINQLIEKAGGITQDATTTNINLSYKLEDEMVIVIYSQDELLEINNVVGETTANTQDITSNLQNQDSVIKTNKNSTTNTTNNSTPTTDNTQEDTQAIININTADETQLTSLNGIGTAKAQNIINYRNENGNFTTIEDIMNVTGIGEGIFAKIKDYITV